MITKNQLLLSLPFVLATQGLIAGLGHSHDGPELYFEHPLIAESPSPDNKVRLNQQYFEIDGEDGEAGADEYVTEFEAEYAFSRSLGIELGIPYAFVEPDEGANSDAFGSVEIALKYANFTFEDQGLLLGGGLELGLPTGNEEKDVDSDHVWEIAPYFSFGYKTGDFQLVGFTEFGFPGNENDEDEADFEFGWNLSLLYTGFGAIKPLIELDGEHVNGGEEDGASVVNLSPGAIYAVPGVEGLEVGASVSFPISSDEEFSFGSTISIFYHY